jgi:putative component of membrane protein insertase Oxa1/YidC/SpoIIIJ protein YidD
MNRQSSIFDSFARAFGDRRQDAVNSLRPRIIDSLAIAAITGYQRYLSPHKGFRCAHRALHQGESCSQYVKREVQEEGLMAALRSSRVRFAECKEANQIIRVRRRDYLLSLSAGASYSTRSLSKQATEDEPSEVEEPSLGEKEQARGNNSSTSDNCNGFDSSCVDAGCESVNCLSAADCGACDLAGLDCGGLDACSGLDGCSGCSW